MKTKIMVGGLVLGAVALTYAAKDPVIMTVNGVDVPRSEFEYLYHKNSQQQLSPQSIDDYAEMFELYKMKVAAAKDAGIDSTSAFKKEMAQYRHELATPYLADSTVLFKLIDETMARSQKEAELHHIMIFKGRSPEEKAAARVRIDSVRKALLDGADFETLAKEVSQDRSVAQNGGNLGYITANRIPYLVEKTTFELPEGKISEVVESPMAYHVLKGGKKRPSRGQVHAAHIMKMVNPNSDEATEASAKAFIDSIYKVVAANPASFEEIATKLSDDKGSARQGGQLPWFGSGEMVPEFDSVAFATPDGTIALPVRTRYGWHIIKKYGHRLSPAVSEMKPMLLSRFSNPQDDRYKIIRDAQTNRLASKLKGKINKSNFETLVAATSQDGIDSTFYARFLEGPTSKLPIASIGKNSITAGEFLKTVPGVKITSPAAAAEFLNDSFASFYNKKLIDAEEDWLYDNVADYRNLINEYHDGSLLYEISLREVWDKASKDKEGLENYFNTHHSDYKWDSPRVKGILIQAANDSVADLVRKSLTSMGGDTIVNAIRKEFKGKATADKVLTQNGQNPMIDNLMFDGPKVEPSNSKYTVYFLYDARLLNEPEEVNDVRGLVTNDYQNQLETEWIADLKNRYPVKVNEKELKKIK